MVSLSFLVSLIGATTAIALNDLRRKSTTTGRSRALLAAVSFCIGGIAVFMMHFVGMGGIILISPDTGLPMPITYDVLLTLLSILVAVAGAWLGLFIVSKDPFWAEVVREKRVALMIEHTKYLTMTDASNVHKVRATVLFNSPWRILAGGLCIAIGVCSMHYCGMCAMRLNATMTVRPGIVVLSFVIALVAACAGSWLIFRVLTFNSTLLVRTSCSFVIALAVCGMHYTGMYGVEYRYTSYRVSTGPEFGTTLPQTVSVLAFLLCFGFDAWVRDQLLSQIALFSASTKTAPLTAMDAGPTKLEARAHHVDVTPPSTISDADRA
ncbi:hypothetical protein PBRA_003953 [Plasmodiophora brassicae]|nr:hypothetical protein PBRA_003953 [Plasmodiophora brassicae]